MRARLLPVAALLMTSALTATAQPPAAQDDALVVDIFALMDRLAVEMNKEFIIDVRLRGAQGMSTSREGADYDSLLAILRSMGYAAIEVGDQIRIVPEAVARSEPSPVLNEDDDRISDHTVVTRVIDVADLQFTQPDGTVIEGGPQLVPVLRPMMSTNVGNITSVPGSTKLIIVDRYDNVRRITAIVDELRQ